MQMQMHLQLSGPDGGRVGAGGGKIGPDGGRVGAGGGKIGPGGGKLPLSSQLGHSCLQNSWLRIGFNGCAGQSRLHSAGCTQRVSSTVAENKVPHPHGLLKGASVPILLIGAH